LLEPAPPIIDPHHHPWDLRARPGAAFAQKAYLCEDTMVDHSVRYDGIYRTPWSYISAPRCSEIYWDEGGGRGRGVGGGDEKIVRRDVYKIGHYFLVTKRTCVSLFIE
jgi:hypothetical protein